MHLAIGLRSSAFIRLNPHLAADRAIVIDQLEARRFEHQQIGIAPDHPLVTLVEQSPHPVQAPQVGGDDPL